MLPAPNVRAVVVTCAVLVAFAASCDGCDTGAGEGEGVAGEGEGVVGEGEGGEGEGGLSADERAATFDPDHVVEVDVTMDPNAFAEMSGERRDVVDVFKPGCLDEPFPTVFHKYTADVVVDGVSFPGVTIRKRGFLGSLSALKPGLKIKTADDATITLSNAVQDPSLLHQCLTYELFDQAGVPAPRCNFAHVVVNGTDFGVYVHVEDVREDFLNAHFGDASGNLYEGTLSDFTPDWHHTFDEKSGSSGSTIGIIEAALAADTDNTALDAVLDVDEFDRFWASEVLVGHWDGYSGNQNNFFVYGDPTSGKAAFIPWGPDQTWGPSITTPFQSVAAQGILTQRLYENPAGQAAYEAALASLLDDVWDEDHWHDEVARMNALIAPFVPAADQAAQSAAIQPILDFIDGRRSAIENELAAGPPAWPAPLRTTICLPQAGTIDATFSTTFGTWPTNDTLSTGDGTFTAALLGATLTPGVDGSGAPQVGAAAGLDPNVPSGDQTVIVSPEILVDSRVFFYVVVMPTDAFASGTFVIDDINVQVVFFLANADGTTTNEGRAYDGTLTLTASTTTAAPVSGTVHADFIQIGF